MDRKDSAFEAGMAVRSEMFGASGVQRLTQATEFNRPFEDLVTRYCFGDVRTRPGIDGKTRSLMTLAALAALTKTNLLKLHVSGALANGATAEEIREVMMGTAI